MRYNLTETHIAGIAAAVLAIVIIMVAVGLMSVAQPSNNGNGTLSPTVGGITETASPETHTPGLTPASPTMTQTSTTTTTKSPSTEPPPEDNQGIDPSKVSVTPKCTDSKTGKAWYELTNENAKTATISFSSTAGGNSDSVAVQGGGGSAEISIPATGNNAALVIKFPGIDGGTYDGARYPPASNACNGGTNGGSNNGTDDGTNGGADGGNNNGTDGGSNNGTDDGTASPPAVTISDQTASDDQTITVEQATLPNGGFVVLSTEDNSRAGTSGYIDPGTQSGIQISLLQKMNEEKTYMAMLYNDTNGNNQFDEGDMPYTKQGTPVSDTGTVTPGSTTGGDGGGGDGGDGGGGGGDGGGSDGGGNGGDDGGWFSRVHLA